MLEYNFLKHNNYDFKITLKASFLLENAWF